MKRKYIRTVKSEDLGDGAEGEGVDVHRNKREMLQRAWLAVSQPEGL